MTLDLLISDYYRRIATATAMLDTKLYPETRIRIEVKIGCYRTFLSELEKIKT